MPVTIRNFEPADFETLWRIDQECFPPGISYSRAELKFYIRRAGAFTLVAVNPEPGAIAADPKLGQGRKIIPPAPSAHPTIAAFIVSEDHRGSGHIITIDVVAAARRSGIGSLLLYAAEDRLRSLQCRSLELETAVDNLSALSFYKRHGYSVIKTHPRYYSNGADALVLEKQLA